MNHDATKAKKALQIKLKERVLIDTDFLSTGLTLLNLATYGRTFGGLAKGFIYRVIGKSQSAKSFLCRNILAEAANNRVFDEYLLIHDDIEKGVLLDNRKFFGNKLAERIRPPAVSKTGQPIYSITIMDLYQRMNEYLSKGKKFIWIVDSQDSLQSMGTTKMGDGKAKIHADQLRQINDDRLAETGSIIIFVHHAKVNLQQSWFEQTYTTGGASPEFYSTLDIRLAKLGPIKRPIGDLKYTVGNWVSAHVTKNRLSGIDRTVKFSIYPSYGLDDIGSCIAFLVNHEHWEKTKGSILAPELNFEGNERKLIEHVESKNLERELRVLTGKVWKEIEDKLSFKRKAKYQ